MTITYAGPPARVRLYGTTAGTGLEDYVSLTVTRGAPTTSSPGSCAGFEPDPFDYLGFGEGVVFRGRLGDFPDAYEGAVEEPVGFPGETWTDGESHAYRFHVRLEDANAAQGLGVVQSFTWETRAIP